MTPAELLALADAAKGYMDRGYLVEDDKCLAAQETLRELGPDLARLVAEMGEALEELSVEGWFASWSDDPRVVEIRAALAKLSELEART